MQILCVRFRHLANALQVSTLIRVGFLGVRFEMRVGGGITSPCLKLVRILIEIETSHFSTKAILILLISAFALQKVRVLWLK